MQGFRRVLGVASIVGVSAVALAVSGGAGGSPTVGASGSAVDLTGEWRGNDGSTYYIRQVGRTAIWWAGFSGRANSPSLGLKYSNVFRGTISGSTIRGNWVGVPRGDALGGGVLTLKIEAGNPPTLRKESGTGLLTKTWDKES
jgi:hypothetical protein